MKIAIFHELHSGGARRGTNEFAKQLKNRGHKVDLYTIGSGKNKDEEIFYNRIYQYEFYPKIWKGHNWKIRLYKDSIELIKICLFDRKVAKIIEKRNYDLAYVAASDYIESPFILNFLKIPKFFYCNDPYYRIIYEPELFNKIGVSRMRILYENLNRFIRKHIDRWNIGKADFIIAISQFANNSFNSAYNRFGDIVYYGVDTKFFSPQKKIRDIDLLYVGSSETLDGYSLFKNTVEKIKHKVKIREVLVEKEWLGDKDLLNVYQRSKILIAPAFREPLGLVPLEAMSCGVVVVAVDDGAHKETVVNGKTGFVVKNDPRLIAQKIDWLLENSRELTMMSTNSRNIMVEKWNWENRGKELESLLVEKLKEYRGR